VVKLFIFDLALRVCPPAKEEVAGSIESTHICVPVYIGSGYSIYNKYVFTKKKYNSILLSGSQSTSLA
jgi:hypothetical protein